MLKIILDSLNKVDVKSELQVKSKKVVALCRIIRVRTFKLIYKKQNIDLIALRTKIIFQGRVIRKTTTNNNLEIYGKGWPEAIGERRF